MPNRAMVGNIVYSIACITSDGGALTGTLTVTFTPLDGTSDPVTQTCDLNTPGDGGTHSLPVMLAPGSTISFDFEGGGTYGAASYNLIVSWIPACSDQFTNQADNLLI